MKKILYIITQSELGGAQRYILDLTTAFKNQYSVEVAAGGTGEFFNQLKQLGIKTHRLKHLVREINPIKDIQAYAELKSLYRQLRPDIVHLNSSKAGVIGSIAAKKAGVSTVVYTVHGFVFNEHLPRLKKRFYVWAEKFSARYKDHIICVSEHDRQTGIAHHIAADDTLVTIHNGIANKQYYNREHARTELKLPLDKTIIGTIGNFYANKNYQQLIDSFKSVATANPNVLLVIIGDGQQRDELKTQIKALNLEKRVVLVGQKMEAEKYLPGFDIYVCSSLKEGLPYSILEAMRVGVPIVSTMVGGIPELLIDKKNGLLIPAHDSQALTQAIQTLLINKNLADQLGRQAQQDAEQNFSSDKMIAATERLYR